jgi:hypothetical protein
MASQTEILNMALLHLGQEQILNPDEEGKAANILKAGWDFLVDDLLAKQDWTFARKRMTLPQLAEVPPFGFAFAYQLPADYLRLPNTQMEDDNVWSLQPWRKEGSKILTDETEVALNYIARVGPESFSAEFVLPLTYRLAAFGAVSITTLPGLAKQMMDLYLGYMIEAQVADARQIGRVVKSSAWLNSRS